MSLKIEIQHKKQIRKVVDEMYRNTRREAKMNWLQPKKMKTVERSTNTSFRSKPQWEWKCTKVLIFENHLPRMPSILHIL